MLTEIISIAAGFIVAGITALLNFIKSKLNAKTRSKVEKIAAVVEDLYNGCESIDKLNAFKEICSAKKINVEKAVKYLEEKIIPLSKKINCYEIVEEQPKDNRLAEVTN